MEDDYLISFARYISKLSTVHIISVRVLLRAGGGRMGSGNPTRTSTAARAVLTCPVQCTAATTVHTLTSLASVHCSSFLLILNGLGVLDTETNCRIAFPGWCSGGSVQLRYTAIGYAAIRTVIFKYMYAVAAQ